MTDPSGLGVQCPVHLTSQSNEDRKVLVTDKSGDVYFEHLPYGIYRLEIHKEGFAEVSKNLSVHSAVPLMLQIKLEIAPVKMSVIVKNKDTLVDPYQAGSSNQIGTNVLEARTNSLPGRSLQDLINTQPGWLYEGNAVLHPRGSEYQTQFVVDGIPLGENRSPGFGPEIEADDVSSLNIYTAGIPAEFGRKMGGIVEVNTISDVPAGLHGKIDLSGGSFDTAQGFAQLQYSQGKNTIGATAEGGLTARYLNPVVPQNFTNRGTTGDFSANYERQLSTSDQFNVVVRHELSRYLIPNEQIQQAAGQRQDADNFEDMGMVSYQHIISANAVANVRGMVRSDSNDLSSNELSTPVIAFQHNSFSEGYFSGSLSVHHGRHNWKAGAESDNVFLHENFSDHITNPSQFDDGTPSSFRFNSDRPDLEQSAYIEDSIALGRWNIQAGLRWDHYQLVVNQNAISPRLAVSRFFNTANLVLHVSYDRVFQTPSSENLLLASSPAVQSLNPSVLRLPVEPSHGNYYEAGLSKGFFGNMRLDANSFRRDFNNYADDDQLLNTAVSFPIAFRNAVIYGAEGKLEIPEWKRISGFASYSYIVGNVWFPVTGGLFLGDDALSARTQLAGHFPDSQDQRNTVRARVRYQPLSRLWFAFGGEYGSGLPFEFTGTIEQAIAQYGGTVVDRINFDRGRIRPSLSLDSSLSLDIYRHESRIVRVQADVQNLNNRLNIIDFGGLFSGNAIAPPRSYFLRLTSEF
ncbi:MAG TPA: TonB-dependent receptor [Terriglobales bacterium]